MGRVCPRGAVIRLSPVQTRGPVCACVHVRACVCVWRLLFHLQGPIPMIFVCFKGSF